MERSVEIEATAITFPRPADFDALAAVGDALASIPHLWQVEVWLGTTAEYWERGFWRGPKILK